MKANQGAIVLIDQPADHGRLRSVLHDWGYTETEIQRFLNENEMNPLVQVSMTTVLPQATRTNTSNFVDRRTWVKHPLPGDNTRPN